MKGFWEVRSSALFLVATLLALGTVPPVFAADTKAEIAALERKCLGALDVNEKMDCYTSSKDLVIFGVAESELDGPAAVRANFERAFQIIRNPKFEIINLEVIPDGALAVAVSVQHVKATLAGGRPIDTSFRVTDVWRKEDSGWKIVHAHSSYPINPTTGAPEIHVQ